MRVRCRATADYRSNAVGAVELECTPAGLSVTLAGVCSYREGYAPGPAVESGTVCVPWPGVYATLLGSDELLLSVEAGRLPLNRFRLGAFAEVSPPEDPRAARARRLRWGLGLGLVAVTTLALYAREALPYPDAVRNIGVAVLLATSIVAVLRAAGRRKLSPEEVLHELSVDLAQHLAHHIPSEPAASPRRTDVVPALAARLPRSAFAVAVTLAATSLAALVGSSAARPHLGAGADERSALPSWPPARLSVASPAASDPGASDGSSGARPGQPTLSEACRCRRDESWLWSGPMPRLSPLVLAASQREHDAHPHLELDVALVNDGASPQADLTLTVLLYEEAAGSGSQRQTGERVLHVDGPLAPGGVARWHVEGMATSVDLIAPEQGNLAADASDVAPADTLAELGTAPERALRLHAARLLAFAGDARAQSIARALQPTASAGEAAVIERILDESAFAACDLSAARESTGLWRARACVQNRSLGPRALSRARLLAFAEPFDAARPGERVPSLLAELSSPLAAELPPETGRRLTLVGPLTLEEGRAPRAFELVLEENVR